MNNNKEEKVNGIIINSKIIDSKKDGKLLIYESMKDIPFIFKRIFIIKDIDNFNIIRGKHAHKKLQQAIFCLSGGFQLTCDDGKKKYIYNMEPNKFGIVIDSMIWATLDNWLPNTIVIVFASEHYNEKDYIRNYNEFLKLSKSGDNHA